MSPPEIDVRLAGYGDIQAIVAFDAEAKTDRSALNFVNQTIACAWPKPDPGSSGVRRFRN